MRENLFEFIKEWNVSYEKPIQITKEYFGKIRLLLKSEISESKNSKVDFGKKSTDTNYILNFR